MDYNKEVPFQHVVPKGKFDPGAEETPYVDPFKSNMALQQMEQRRRDDDEKSMREMDEKKMKKLKVKDLPKAINLLNKTDNFDALGLVTQIKLKAPQISNDELDEIAKYNKKFKEPLSKRGGATKALLGEMT